MRRIAIDRFSAVCVLSAVVLLAAIASSAQEKRHQATGTIATSGATQLVLLKTFGRNQAHWNFVLNPKTKLEGKLTKGQRVRIYYVNDAKGQRVAEEIKILAAATFAPSGSAAKPTPAAAPNPPPQPAH